MLAFPNFRLELLGIGFDFRQQRFMAILSRGDRSCSAANLSLPDWVENPEVAASGVEESKTQEIAPKALPCPPPNSVSDSSVRLYESSATE